MIMDYIILGAGPAGLQMAYFLEQEQINYVIIEQGNSPGSFFSKFPRHRKLISINKIHTGNVSQELSMRWDWNSLLNEDGFYFKNYDKEYFPNADNLCRYLRDFSKKYHLNTIYNTKINSIRKSDLFCLTAENGDIFKCKKLIIATGLSQENLPLIKGIEYAIPYSQMDLDSAIYRNKRVIIIGKGNSAFETADHLISEAESIHVISPNPLKLAWKTHYVGHLRAVNNNLLDTYHLKSQNSVQNAHIEWIRKSNDGLEVMVNYTKTQNETKLLKADYVLACTGFRLDKSIFQEGAIPETMYNDKYPALTPEWESKNVRNMYFIGTLMHGLDFKKSFSGFIHGFRYNIAVLKNMLLKKYHNKPWPQRSLTPDRTGYAKVLLDDLAEHSSLFQQPGFLGNVILFNDDNDIYYRDVPVDFINYGLVPQKADYLVVTLEYGPQNVIDPFDANDTVNESILFLHPVARFYINGILKKHIHLRQDLEHAWNSNDNIYDLNNWIMEEFRQRLPDYKQGCVVEYF